MTQRSNPSSRRAPQRELGSVAHLPQGTLRSCTIGALPILNHLLQRLHLESILQTYLPRADPRRTLPVAQGLMVLVKNLLLCREPLYGLGDWAARYDPLSLGLTAEHIQALNDDRIGRCLTVLFHCDRTGLILDVVRHVVQEFSVRLDELHNDSTTVSFFGAYSEAATEKDRRDHRTLAITWGHSKDHRPDLKQLLYILTISDDGGVPVHFRAASGNVTDDTTHRDNWELLCHIAGRRDFLYVADCKLATIDNMNYIATNGGRFVSVLPRTRKEDAAFRTRLLNDEVVWQPIMEKLDEQGEIVDVFSACAEPVVLPEGYRLCWFHSTRKAELDLTARSNRLQRAQQQLQQLQKKLRGPRARQRDRGQIQDAVQKILEHYDVASYFRIEISQHEQETFQQRQRGRPGRNTAYVRKVRSRFDLDYTLDMEQLARERKTDGIFPLVSNAGELSTLEVLDAYKRQPQVEKRFAQLKTDFAIAPVFLKDVGRIEALFCVYFLVLLVEALLERELRQAMERQGIESLPLYPEGRPCRCPTARRVIDVFEPIQRHTLQQDNGAMTTQITELTRLQRKLVRMLGLSAVTYRV